MELPNAVPWGCDVCGKPRSKDVNHWWVLTIEPAVVESPENIPELTVTPYTDDFARRKGAAHACGQSHALVLVTRYMSQGNFERMPQESGDGTASAL